MRTRAALICLIPVLGLLVACVAPPLNRTQTAELQTESNLQKFAGPPIDSFTWLGSYDGFRTLSDKEVVLFPTINDGYLIRVRDPCMNLRLANHVGLTSSDRTVSRNFDHVIADNVRCRIDTIRHIDYAAYKRARDSGAGS
jgi:Family of unknown function (DUF6491)